MPLKPDQFAPLDPGIAQYLIDQLAPVDGDHLLALPFMPEDKRAGALSILAFTAELREVPLRVTDPLLGAIRLEWWREALEEVFGNRPARRHPLVIALQTTLSSHPPLKPLLSEVIEGTALFLEAGEVTTPEEALGLFKVHDGARSGLLYHYLTMAQQGEERRHLFERAGALYGLSRAVLNLRPQDIRAPKEIETPAARYHRAAASRSFSPELIEHYQSLWRSIGSLTAEEAAIAAPLKWARPYLSEKKLSPLQKRLSLFWTVLRGR